MAWNLDEQRRVDVTTEHGVYGCLVRIRTADAAISRRARVEPSLGAANQQLQAADHGGLCWTAGTGPAARATCWHLCDPAIGLLVMLPVMLPTPLQPDA